MSDEVTRKLASVRSIEAIEPIEGADNIVCATVDGWKLVTQKSNNFQKGDLVVYFEIDSFLPEVERFEFLRPSSYRVMDNVGGFRIKTIKLRGQVSQGLILPLSEFADRGQMEEGDDLTELLGIKKFERPIPAELQGKAKGSFPDFIQKTDQERIQNIWKYRHRNKGRDYEVTLKLDGSSMTVYKKDDVLGVCSRNLDLIETEGNAFWQAAREYVIVGLEKYPGNIAIQGELMGPGIQGNRENFKGLKFFVFDIFDIDNYEYLNYDNRVSLINTLNLNGSKLDTAPLVKFENIDNFESVDEFLRAAEISSINHPIAEGIVFKNKDGKRHSFKVISNKFLLKEKD